MKDMWNARYSEPEYAYGTEPNAFFREILSTLRPGRILLPAEGEGRNAVFAASIGWDVHAFDFSEEGRKKALALSAERNAPIRYDIADFEEIDLPDRYFDAAGLFFVHLPPAPRKLAHAACSSALREGGMLILEAFSKQQLDLGTGGPKDERLLYSLEDLKDDFPTIEFEVFERRTVDLGEGRFHRGEADVVRLAGIARHAAARKSAVSG